jgi:hypothetical protein
MIKPFSECLSSGEPLLMFYIMHVTSLKRTFHLSGLMFHTAWVPSHIITILVFVWCPYCYIVIILFLHSVYNFKMNIKYLFRKCNKPDHNTNLELSSFDIAWCHRMLPYITTAQNGLISTFILYNGYEGVLIWLWHFYEVLGTWVLMWW